MTAKKKYHIALLPEVHEVLRRMAFESHEAIGDVIRGLLEAANDEGLLLPEDDKEITGWQRKGQAKPISPDLSDYLMRGYKEPSGIPNLSDMRIISDDEYGCPSCSQTFDDVEKCREHIRKEHGGK